MSKRFVFVSLLLLAAVPSAVSAHEKYFVDSSLYPTQWSFFYDPLTVAFALAAVVGTIIWRTVFVRLPVPTPGPLKNLGKLAPWIPRLLGVHLGVSLLALAVRGAFLSPSLSVHALPGGDLWAVVQGALGVWFISGVRLRPAAVGLALIGPLSLFIAGPVALLESLPLLGIAAFLVVLPPSGERYGAVALDPERVRVAMQLLRIGVGIGLVVVSISEKFANPALANAILTDTPQLNVFGLLGVEVSNELFIRIAASTELFFGLLILSGAGAPLIAIIAAVPFTATIALFGATELFGHLPVFGVFLALLVYGSMASTRDAVSSLRPAPIGEVSDFAHDRVPAR